MNIMYTDFGHLVNDVIRKINDEKRSKDMYKTALHFFMRQTSNFIAASSSEEIRNTKEQRKDIDTRFNYLTENLDIMKSIVKTITDSMSMDSYFFSHDALIKQTSNECIQRNKRLPEYVKRKFTDFIVILSEPPFINCKEHMHDKCLEKTKLIIQKGQLPWIEDNYKLYRNVLVRENVYFTSYGIKKVLKDNEKEKGIIIYTKTYLEINEFDFLHSISSLNIIKNWAYEKDAK